MKRIDQRWWDWPASLLLLALFWVASLRLDLTRWTDDLSRIMSLTLIGVSLGLLLGQSRFKGWFSAVYGVLFSLFVIPWQLGLTMDKQVLWLERLSSIGGRLWVTLDQFIQNKPIEDSVLFLTAMMFVYWLASLTAGYRLTRSGKPWFGLALVCITVLVIEFYDPPRALRGWYSSVFAILVVLLASRLYFLHQRRHWEIHNIPMDTETGGDWMRAAVVSGIILVILAWNIPSWLRALSPGTPERRDLIQSWLMVREKLSNIVAPLSGSAPTEGEYYQNNLLMGTDFTLSDEIVFSVTSSEPRPSGSRFYWRARSYDRYQGGKWFSTFTDRQEVTPVDQVLPLPAWKERFDSTFTFTLQTSIIRNFFSPGLPVSISRPAQDLGRIIDPTFLDTATLLAVPPLRAGEVYQIIASISAPIQEDIQKSSGEYPETIHQAYLQLPADFPEEIRTLAEEITAEFDTPYEKAEAITNYLRQNIEYKSTIKSAPYYMDPIEYMLFTTREGFCFYYASAEILMLRSIGIPARLAVGFAEGETNNGRTTFTVRRKDAHAWPEVYFNDFGWIEFEPTVNQSALVRRELSDRASDSGNQIDGPLITEDDGRDRTPDRVKLPKLLDEPAAPPAQLPANRSMIVWLSLIPVLVFIGLGWFLWRKYRFRKLTFPPLAIAVENNLMQHGFSAPGWIHERARLARLSPLERAFNAVPKALRLLRRPANSSLTPAEQVARLIETLPESQTPALALLAELHRGMYSPLPANLEQARKSSRQILHLAWRTWLRKVIHLESFQSHPSGF